LKDKLKNVTEEEIVLLRENRTMTEIADLYKCSRTGLYAHLERLRLKRLKGDNDAKENK